MKGGGCVVACLLVASLLLSSCGAGAKLRRAEKLIAKAEAQGAQWKVDTVFKEIFIPVPEVIHDTTFVITEAETDTFTIEKERLKVQIIRRVDTLRVEAECLPDTIKIETPVIVTREITAPKPYWNLWKVGGAFLFALVIGFVVGRVIRK